MKHLDDCSEEIWELSEDIQDKFNKHYDLYHILEKEEIKPLYEKICINYAWRKTDYRCHLISELASF